jgi:hypothetical protein
MTQVASHLAAAAQVKSGLKAVKDWSNIGQWSNIGEIVVCGAGNGRKGQNGWSNPGRRQYTRISRSLTGTGQNWSNMVKHGQTWSFSRQIWSKSGWWRDFI